MKLTIEQIAERAHDHYVLSALDRHVPVNGDWVDLPNDDRQAFMDGISAALDMIADDSERVVLPYGGCANFCAEDEFNSISEWVRSLK